MLLRLNKLYRSTVVANDRRRHRRREKARTDRTLHEVMNLVGIIVTFIWIIRFENGTYKNLQPVRVKTENKYKLMIFTV